ncbi:MAG TPA: succinate dehydrogenase [Candidatus Poseidoniales archaeon]|nr:MAG TPA: succinate dehydrogenase [Candidatus Poseidoniales archaeon]HII61978.1 succinate dehydrogenase [Candidatus Poseidoniaceae archaeon]
MGEGLKLPVINGMGKTNRIDNWISQPLAMGLALIAAMIYTTWRLFFYANSISYSLEGSTVTSPIFSPNILEWNLFNLNQWNHPDWVNAAILILWVPFGFRGTCYYMRRVYYRSFFQSPTACWVDEPQINKSIGYHGEKRLFILNNLHRYFLYAAIIILVIKWWDVTHTLKFDTGWGFSIGTFVMLIEAFLLTMYVTSCHALRHLSGGILDRWTKGVSALRGTLFKKLSVLNRSHGFWFWTSLAFVFIGDLWTLAVAERYIDDVAIILVGS